MKEFILIISLLLTTTVSLFCSESINENKVIYLCEENPMIEEDIDFRLMVLKLAAERKIVFAAEGLDREPSLEKGFYEMVFKTKANAYFYGIEDPVCSLFAAVLMINSDFRYFNELLLNLQNSYSIERAHIIDSLTSSHNQKVLKDFWENSTLITNAIFAYVLPKKDGFPEKEFMDPSDFRLFLQNELITRTKDEWMIKEWVEFTRQVALALEPVLEKGMNTKQLEKLKFLITCLDEFSPGSPCEKWTEPSIFLDTLNLDLRNIFIIRNLKEIYSITKDIKKPLIAILEQAQIEGVKEELEDQGFTVLGTREFVELGLKNEL